MNTKIFSTFTIIAAIFFSANFPAQASSVSDFVRPVAFSDSAEAGMLRRAYVILSTGDHDYKGHRVKAMHAVKSAADLLGLDLRGDGKAKEPQPLSDEKLREAQGMLEHVLGSAEVKREKRISKHVEEAIHQINLALEVR